MKKQVRQLLMRWDAKYFFLMWGQRDECERRIIIADDYVTIDRDAKMEVLRIQEPLWILLGVLG